MSVTEPTPSAQPRTKTLATITIVVAFLVGVVLGAAGFWAWVLHHHGGRLPFMAALREHRIVHHLDHELDLTPQQHDQVVAIIHERGKRIDAILGDLQPQVRREIDETNNEIEKILTPSQKAKFAQLRMRLHSRRHTPEASSPAGSPNP